MIQEILLVSCDQPGCHACEGSFETNSQLVTQLSQIGWLYKADGTDLCPRHNRCGLCGEPWDAEIHAGPADTPSLHLFER